MINFRIGHNTKGYLTCKFGVCGISPASSESRFANFLLHIYFAVFLLVILCTDKLSLHIFKLVSPVFNVCPSRIRCPFPSIPNVRKVAIFIISARNNHPKAFQIIN